ncbi:hypothetical protein CQA49_01105 [Helicobacter sp. MIT 00-7814]|uniref:hypothetical protein n=1 Tax=unclassified Helicobacter TaxID=2593540 RepID=UPI000E1E5C68|nr:MULTISPECIES: hypothetical protein [unclassified Helicobacter]RDU55107.1 hypothetical protein CQA37_04695 [Helicobacter sp. MIT 99-10781]RDU56926.1 hypothetical protein CQA49_01105 [Helicobacter sp. MIT 00-7814]
MKKTLYAYKIALCMMILASSFVFGDNFLSLGENGKILQRVGFIEGGSYEYKRAEVKFGLYKERAAIFIQSQAMKDFVAGKKSGDDTISAIYTKNGFTATRTNFKNPHKSFYYHSTRDSRLYEKIAPKSFALRQVEPNIFVIENFTRHIVPSSCNIVRSNTFTRQSDKKELILNAQKNYAPKEQNITFHLECEINESEEYL